MQVFEINPDKPEPRLVKDVVSLLKRGKVVAYPTDTLYGLGADAFNQDALHRIAILKGRRDGKPFPYIIDSAERLAEWSIALGSLAGALAEEFWPGPVSFVLKGSKKLPGHILDSKGRLCLRVPQNKIARSIAGQMGGMIVATSANPSGAAPSRTARQAMEYFRGEIDAVVDGGPSPHGMASTILDVSEGKIVILREGAVPGHKVLSALAEAQKRLGLETKSREEGK